MAIPKYDESTGKRLDKPIIKKFGPRTFAKRSADFKKLGWTVTVLYDPTEYIKDYEEKRAGAKNARVQAAIDRKAEILAQKAADEKTLAEARQIVEDEKIRKAAEEKAAEAIAEKDKEIATLKEQLSKKAPAAPKNENKAANNESQAAK